MHAGMQTGMQSGALSVEAPGNEADAAKGACPAILAKTVEQAVPAERVRSVDPIQPIGSTGEVEASRAGGASVREAGFGMPAKAAVFLLFTLTCSFDLDFFPMLALSLASIAYVAWARELRMALLLLAFFGLIGGAYVAYTVFGIHPFIISPAQAHRAWHGYPIMSAAFVMLSSPPGLISSALSRVRCPRKIILGTLVFLRFFPTFGASWRLLRDSLRKRGLSSIRHVIANPIDSYEYLMVPILLSLVNSADQLSSSAVTRAAEAPSARTSYYARPFVAADLACIAACAACCAAAFVASGAMPL